MGVSSKAILKADVSPEEIAAALADQFGIEDMKITLKEPDTAIKAILTFTEPFGYYQGNRRMAYIFDGQMIQDYLDIYDGERTYVSLGASGLSCDYLEFLSEKFGGLVNKTDTNDIWTNFDKVENTPRISAIYSL